MPRDLWCSPGVARIIEYDGRSMTCAEWSAWARNALGIDISPSQIRERLRIGWPAKEAITRPLAAVDPLTLGKQRLNGARRKIARAEAREDAIRAASAPMAPFLTDPSLLPKSPPRRLTKEPRP